MLGSKIKELREKQGLLQRELSSQMDIDTPMFSKIERGERKARREQVIKLAEILKVSSDELIALWLADKIHLIIKDEKNASQALEIVKKEYKKK